ncbi:hypothetical protein VPNG_06327 [Cytospora leucostoma]|uniref:Uncharacterized protein n=1 Tax=Cytospora leucostoma TaxID=1230097 RepID=A0A423X1U6_9PEZI|nr:hypothetical protein VPNG_06327 [Cytospora leucostoma]
MSINNLLTTVSQAINNVARDHSNAPAVIAARTEVSQRISDLQYKNSHQWLLAAVKTLVEHLKLGVEVQGIAQNCAWSALQDITRNAERYEVSDHVAHLYGSIRSCIEEEQGEWGYHFNLYLVLLLVFLIMTVLLGPSWPLLLPLRVLGFGSLGIRAGSLAAWLQSVLFGGWVPAGGWFARATSWGMKGAGSLVAGALSGLFAAAGF